MAPVAAPIAAVSATASEARVPRHRIVTLDFMEKLDHLEQTIEREAKDGWELVCMSDYGSGGTQLIFRS